MKTCCKNHIWDDSKYRQCPTCAKDWHRKWYLEHRDEELKKATERHHENRPQLREWEAEYRRTNPEKFLGYRIKRKKNHPLFGSYRGMLERCLNPKSAPYKDYGGRGITVCERWQGKCGYENFVSDMGNKPTPKHSLDRKDNEKGYSPENCRWATSKEQRENQRNSKLYSFNGKTMTAAGWAKELKINPATFSIRAKRGLTGEELFKPNPHGKYTPPTIITKFRLLEAVRLLRSLVGDIQYEGKDEIEFLVSKGSCIR